MPRLEVAVPLYGLQIEPRGVQVGLPVGARE
jgi:hypothetical protein